MDIDYEELRDLGRLAAFMGAGIVFIALVLAGVVASNNAIMRQSCAAQFKDSAFQYSYGFYAGCRINVPGKGWIPSDNYRAL